MTKENHLKDPAAALRAFSAGLGDAAPDWAAREGLGELRYRREDLSRDVATALTLDQLCPLAEAYRDALRCRFLLGGMVVLDVGPGLGEGDLVSFREDTADSPTVVLDVVLDKDALLQSWLEDIPDRCHPFLYLFPAALERLFRVPPDKLSDLEHLLWGEDAASKAVILVPDRDVWLNGPYLAVIGGDGVSQWRQALPAGRATDGPERYKNGCDKVQDEGLSFIVETRANLLKWDEPWVNELTPRHLKLAGDGEPGDGPIAALLERHLVNLVLLYTADRSRRRDGAIWATYAGDQYRAELALLPTTCPDPVPSGGARDLLEIFEWAYDPNFYGDKLPLVQVGIAQALQAAHAEVRPRLLLQNSPAIYEGLQYHWKAFVERKVDAYVTQVRALEDYVDETIQIFADQISDMIADLTKNMLAAVGVVVGSVIGSLFKESFSPLILSIGLFIYTLYIFLLPLRFGMPHRWEAYQALRDDFVDRRRRFEALLFEDRVKKIVGDRIDDSQERFERWFTKAKRAYVDLIVAALVAAAVALAYALIVDLGATTPSPIATPTVPAP
jgi:hypothetical protein